MGQAAPVNYFKENYHHHGCPHQHTELLLAFSMEDMVHQRPHTNTQQHSHQLMSTTCPTHMYVHTNTHTHTHAHSHYSHPQPISPLPLWQTCGGCEVLTLGPRPDLVKCVVTLPHPHLTVQDGCGGGMGRHWSKQSSFNPVVGHLIHTHTPSQRPLTRWPWTAGWALSYTARITHTHICVDLSLCLYHVTPIQAFQFFLSHSSESGSLTEMYSEGSRWA